jgi:hypothetical protein
MKYVKGALAQFKNPYFLIPLLLIVVPIIAQGTAGFESDMKTASSTIWTYAKIIIRIVCFFLMVYFLYHAFMGQNKATAWWTILGILAFVLIIELFPTIYNTIFSYNPVKATTN